MSRRRTSAEAMLFLDQVAAAADAEEPPPAVCARSVRAWRELSPELRELARDIVRGSFDEHSAGPR